MVNVNMKDYEIEQVRDRFNEELKNWDWEKWKAASVSEKEEIGFAFLDDFDFGWVMEEDMWKIFEDWCSKVDETYFS